MDKPKVGDVWLDPLDESWEWKVEVVLEGVLELRGAKGNALLLATPATLKAWGFTPKDGPC